MMGKLCFGGFSILFLLPFRLSSSLSYLPTFVYVFFSRMVDLNCPLHNRALVVHVNVHPHRITVPRSKNSKDVGK